jgi:hypothetical protein
MLLALPWQAILWVELPLAAISFLLAWRLMPADPRRPARPQFDFVGAASQTASALALMVCLLLPGREMVRDGLVVRR